MSGIGYGGVVDYAPVTSATATREMAVTGMGDGGVCVGGPSLVLNFGVSPTGTTPTLDPRITFSRASNATYFDSTGTLQYAPHNLLTYSEQFDNAAWTKARASISANATTAPDGTTTAEKLVEDNTNNTHLCYFTSFTFAPQAYTASFYLKAAERTKAEIVAGSASTAVGLGFDLVAGTTFACTVPGTVAPTSSTITSVGSGWWRCSITWTAIATTGIDPRVYINNGTTATYTGDGTSGIFVWGAQLNIGALQPYYSTTVKNLQGFSQEFNNAVWSKFGATISADVIAAPDGSNTADKLVEDSSTGPHYTTPSSVTALTLGQVVTYSVYAKAAERTFLQLILTGIGSGSSNYVAGFNLATGVAGTPSSGATSNILSVGDGWFRCQLTVTVLTAATPTRQIRVSQNASSTPSSYTGDGTSGIYVWGAQFSDSGSLDAYSYNPVAAPSAAAYYGPRFDYDPITLAWRGLLIEEARTNNHLYSEDLTQWGTPVGSSVSANTAISPDGTQDADKLVEDAANSSHFLSASSITMSYTSGTAYTRSCFLKAAGRNIVTVYLPAATFPSAGRQALFNLSSGTIFSVEAGVTASIQNVGNGWYRCSVTAVANATATGHVGGSALTDNGNGTYTGDGTSGVFIWGAQTETGAFPTSYIPTSTTTLTRSADVASMLGANFSNWYNAVNGTIYAEYDTSNSAQNNNVLSFSDGTTSNRMTLRASNTSVQSAFAGASGGATQWAITAATALLNTPTKAAGAYATNDIAYVRSGGAVGTDTSATIPAVNQLRIGTEADGTLPLNGHIRSISYYPTRLPNSTLQALTS